jgi:pyridoxal phosphate enzyme (YggS family)
MIAEKIAELKAQLGRAKLVAVSKTVDVARIREAVDAGQLDLGENYAQELRDKAREGTLASRGVRWHFIGPLQRNKVKYVVGTAALVHGVDSLPLGQEIDKQATKLGIVQPCLVQVNVASEPQKSGCALGELSQLLDALRALSSLRIDGLMCIPPAEGDPRPHFAKLRELASVHGLTELSMGMSADWRIALDEGATLVRVGSAIFGAR